MTKKSAKFELIKQAKLIIWDEAPMQQRWIMECVDRSLRDLLDVDKPFGGKTIIFSGDYRQVSRVIPKAGKAQIVERTFTNSHLWKEIRKLHLYENERIKRLNISDNERDKLLTFADFLLEIGEGRFPSDVDELIKVPQSMLSKTQDVKQFISEVYGNLQHINPKEMDLNILKTAILTPKNEHMRQINKIAINRFKGKLKEYKSMNEVCDEKGVCTYTTEYLNSLEINGLPEHVLSLKIGAPVMVLRNYDPLNGVCNGTKGIISSLGKFVIEIIINDINDEPKRILLHRISLKPSDPQIGIAFKRHQFPIHLAFAMTINKSQGQTLNKVGLYLAEPVFGHGQLYVALSRVTHPDHIKILIVDTEHQGKLYEDSESVYTKNVVFEEILVSAGVIDNIFNAENDVKSRSSQIFQFQCDAASSDESDFEWID